MLHLGVPECSDSALAHVQGAISHPSQWSAFHKVRLTERVELEAIQGFRSRRQRRAQPIDLRRPQLHLLKSYNMYCLS